MPALRTPRLLYGGDYNPEQWPEEVWREDVRLMREAGVNLVNLGIFSWAKLEPRPGAYTFAWLDRVVDLLHANGVAVDLATGTASPPPWLARLHPGSLPRDENGAVYHPGARQHYCPNSTAYREAAAALTRRLAERYRGHPALAMWHVNNEYACHIPACYCDACAAAFRTWLQGRHGTLDALNESWGTAFWSQAYGAWEEILPPRKAPTYPNPGQQLDYRRFQSDAVLELYRAEREIVRAATPDLPVTTNLMGFFKTLDYFAWARELDFVSWDSYPDPLDGLDGIAANAAAHDLMRSLKGGAPFVLMEQVTSQVNWRPVNRLKRPGSMRAQSYQAVARGADGVLFFQWRAARAGAEKFHGAMVPHVAPEKSRVFREVKELGRELRGLGAVAGSRIAAEVGIVFDWPNWWALELDSKPARIDYAARVGDFHRAFYDRNVPVDFVPVDGDWTRYKMIVAPHLYQLGAATAAAIRAYVAAGGTFVTTYFSGIVDEREHIHLGGYPAPLRDVLGLWVEEWDPHGPGDESRLAWAGDGRTSLALDWSEVIHAEGAEAVAAFSDAPRRGCPAVTRHRFGRGTAHYLGTRLDPATLAGWLGGIGDGLGIRPLVAAPPGVEATLRKKDGRRFLFLVNHRAEAAAADLGAQGGTDLLRGVPLSGPVTIEPHGVRIVDLAPVAAPRTRPDGARAVATALSPDGAK